MKKIVRLLVVVAIVFIVQLGYASQNREELIAGNAATHSSELNSIMGTTSANLSQMINYYEANAKYPDFYKNTDAASIYSFCQIYMEEAAAEGVRAEVAFAQAMKETGFLRYKGDVKIEQFNFAGIGATGGGNCGNSFASVREGVRAQIQHLKGYATTEKLNNTVVDPRYKYVKKGSAPYVEWLGVHENPSGAGWASAKNYGNSIVNDYMRKLQNSSSYSTWYKGVDYGAVYDPNYYMVNQPDVAAVYGNSSEKLIAHFVNYGMDEGRQAKESFDVYSYKNRYKDLRMAFQNELKRYYFHYIEYGKNEGRTAVGTVNYIDGITVYNGVDYAAIYNFEYYRNKNQDIKAAFGDDDYRTLWHFVNYGINEGRIASESFNVYSYRNQYLDLRRAYGSNLSQYYWHYLNYGKSEGRTGVGANQLKDGETVYNGVDYSLVYDYDFYITHNPDIAQAFPNDDNAALWHFVNYGMSEGRQAKASFDVYAYRARYIDLQYAYGDNLPNYYLHYIWSGNREGRSAI